MSYTQGTWDTGAQIRNHTLATSIINLHDTPDAVFDDPSLKELKEFTLSRSIDVRDAFLRQGGMIDDAGAGRVGEKAAQLGSLTGYIIARYGTEEEALDGRDWELLEEWFREGMPVGQNVKR